MQDLETGNVKGVAMMTDTVEEFDKSRSRFEYGIIIIQLLHLVKGLKRKSGIE